MADVRCEPCACFAALRAEGHSACLALTRYYGRIKGVPEKELADTVTRLLQCLAKA